MYNRTYRIERSNSFEKMNVRMILKISGIAVLSFAATLISIAQPSAGQFLTVEGEVTKRLELKPQDLENFPSLEGKAKDRSGKQHTFKGTLLATELDSAGVTMGKALRGKNLIKYVLVTAVDGYQAIFSLPEIDPEFTSNTVLLTTHVDGEPLPKGDGPFRLVAPQDKQQSRWVREISSIKIIIAKN